MNKKKTDIFADDWNSQENLIKRLQNKTEVLNNQKIKEAFEAVDRKGFVREKYQVEAYEDYPLPIGEDQTISQPTTVAYMLELLQPEEGDSILDVGCGSGWTTALLAKIVGEGGQVIGLEIHKSLADFGQNNLSRYEFPQAEIRHANALEEKQPEAPFDKILASAAADEVPDILIRQLKNDGVLVMPVDGKVIRLKKKKEKQDAREEKAGFRFVPLKREM